MGTFIQQFLANLVAGAIVAGGFLFLADSTLDKHVAEVTAVAEKFRVTVETAAGDAVTAVDGAATKVQRSIDGFSLLGRNRN